MTSPLRARTIRAVVGVFLVASAGGRPARAVLPAASAPPASFFQLGADVATKGTAGVPPCASCHGPSGEGNAVSGFPRLAGQSANYLSNQLIAYTDGRRANPVMTPIAATLNPAQREAVATHYSTRGTPEGRRSGTPTAASSPEQAASAAITLRGRALATIGDDARGIQACANCHGPDGIGQWPAYPSLGGQHASYLVTALQEWKDGNRRSDPSGQMPIIAKALGTEDARAVATYYGSLPVAGRPVDPPSTTKSSVNRQQRARTIVSGPTSSAPVKGVGTEQGAPVVGGSQGVGGTPPNTSRAEPSGQSNGGARRPPAAGSGASAPD